MTRQIRFAGRWTETIGWIMGINIAVFLLQHFFPPLTAQLAVVPGRVLPFHPYTLLTYSFLHASIGHIFFNMLTLFFFGGDLDILMGRKRFLILYLGAALTGGTAAALFLHHGIPVIGASAAVYGVLVAYALYFPDTEVLLWFVLPIKVWVLVAVWIGISVFYSVFSATGGGIAHVAHLGGALFAFFYIGRAWRPGGVWRGIKYRWRKRRFKVYK